MSTASASTTVSTVIGYARVSAIGQTMEQQTEVLTAAGAGKLFSDVMSGARDDRPGFGECMQYLREGDTLIVWRLDRLGHRPACAAPSGECSQHRRDASHGG